MWKNRISPRGPMLFYSHRGCGKERTFPQAEKQTDFVLFLHSLCFHIPQPLWKNQREELIFAVMSRMLFCMVSFPPFKATSTFRMA